MKVQSSPRNGFDSLPLRTAPLLSGSTPTAAWSCWRRAFHIPTHFYSHPTHALHSNHIATTYQSHTNHIPITYYSHPTYAPHTSLHIPSRPTSPYLALPHPISPYLALSRPTLLYLALSRRPRHHKPVSAFPSQVKNSNSRLLMSALDASSRQKVRNAVVFDGGAYFHQVS